MLYRFYNVLGSYALAFTFELFNRRLWGPYPEWDFVLALRRAIRNVYGPEWGIFWKVIQNGVARRGATNDSR